jgi:predicted nucleic acid-binding protein
MRKVLDAWAVLAWVEGALAAPAVEALLEAATRGEVELFLNLINAGEVYYILAKRRGLAHAEEFLEDLETCLPVQTILPSRALVIRAAKLKSQYPISYADGFAAATALELPASLVTGDADLRAVAGLELEWLG